MSELAATKLIAFNEVVKAPGLVGRVRCLDQSVTLASQEAYSGKLFIYNSRHKL